MKNLFVIALAAAMLTGCGGTGTVGDGKVTISDVVASIQKACGFKTTADQIVRVAVAVAAGIDPAAGATATVAAAVGDQIATRVCDAVKASSSPAVAAVGGDVELTVVVNGVPVTGTVRK